MTLGIILLLIGLALFTLSSGKAKFYPALIVVGIVLIIKGLTG